MDAKDDIDENIDIGGQIMCKEIQPNMKRSKFISSTYPCKQEEPSNSRIKQYSSSNLPNNLNKIIVFHDQDLRRKAFKLNDNLWECELEMKI